MLSNRKKRYQYKRWCHRWRIWKRSERRLFQLFSNNLALIFQDKHNKRSAGLNIVLRCDYAQCPVGQGRSSCQKNALYMWHCL